MDMKALTVSLLIAVLLSALLTVVLEMTAPGWTRDNSLLFALLLGGGLGVIYPIVAYRRLRRPSSRQ